MGKDREKATVGTPDFWIRTINLACLTIFLVIILSVPVWDGDFWWHLASGRYISESGNLPATDPFSYASPEHVPLHRDVILKGYWLAQIISFTVFKHTGLYGIIGLRVFLLTFTIFLLYLWTNRKKCNDFAAAALLILAGWSSVYFTGERPQLFSFFFAPLTVFLLEIFREKKTGLWIFFFAPLTMIFWANCHGGFILGIIILLLYWGTETVRILLQGYQSDKIYHLKLSLLIFIIALASLINPNTYKAYLLMTKFQGSILQGKTAEYLSPFNLIKMGIVLWPYWLYLIITGFALTLSFKKTDAVHLAMTIFLALISLSAFRYIPFFIYVTVPLVSLQLTRVIRERGGLGMFLDRYGIPVLMSSVIVLSFLNYKDRLGTTISNPIEEFRFPVRAASFMKDNHPKGNIFNHFNWGGYLMWKLYPEYKVFVDGRELDLQSLSDYTHMLWDLPEAPQLFDKYRINTVIIPGLSPFTGELFSILNYFIRDEQWHLVYIDDTSLVLVRGNENEDLIKKFSRSKTDIYNHIIIMGEHLQSKGIRSIYLQRVLETAYNARRLQGN